MIALVVSACSHEQGETHPTSSTPVDLLFRCPDEVDEPHDVHALASGPQLVGTWFGDLDAEVATHVDPSLHLPCAEPVPDATCTEGTYTGPRGTDVTFREVVTTTVDSSTTYGASGSTTVVAVDVAVTTPDGSITWHATTNDAGLYGYVAHSWSASWQGTFRDDVPPDTAVSGAVASHWNDYTSWEDAAWDAPACAWTALVWDDPDYKEILYDFAIDGVETSVRTYDDGATLEGWLGESCIGTVEPAEWRIVGSC
jgi:hypothetical protein